MHSRGELIHTAIYIVNKDNMIDELYHHGILGMKWGVRRYQNEDGSVTPAGAKRYYVNGKDDSEGYTKAGQKYKERIDKKNNKEYNKSEHNKRLMIGLGVAAGLTIAAGIAIYKTPEIKEFINTRLDENIRVGDVLQNVSLRSDGSQNREHAYVTNANSGDADKYKGFYAAFQLVPNALSKRQNEPATANEVSDNVTINNIKAKTNAKIAGGISATKSMNKILKGMTDSEKDEYIEALKRFDGQGADGLITSNIEKSIRSGKITKDAYKVMNYSLMNSRDKGSKEFRDKLYSDLRSRGYSGIKDNNDRSSILNGGSGYHSKASILFKDTDKFDYSELAKMTPMQASKSIINGRRAYLGETGDARRSKILDNKKYRNAGKAFLISGGILSATGGSLAVKSITDANKHNSSRLSKSDIKSINDLKGKGYTNERIAKELGVSESTVSNYLK